MSINRKILNLRINVIGKKSYKELHSKLAKNEEKVTSSKNKCFVISTCYILYYLKNELERYCEILDKTTNSEMDKDEKKNVIARQLKKINPNTFLEYFISISASENKVKRLNYKKEDFFLDEYFFNDDISSLDSFFKKSYEEYEFNIFKMSNFLYNGIDTNSLEYTFCNNSVHFPVIINAFIENISNVLTFEVFKKLVIKKFDDFRDVELDFFPLYEFDNNGDELGKVYTVPKNINIDSTLNDASFPLVTTHYLKCIKMDEINYYNYYFSQNKREMSSEEFDSENNDCLVFTAYKRNYNKMSDYHNIYYQYDDNVLLFTNFEEANNYYRKKLFEVKSKIEKILNISVIY